MATHDGHRNRLREKFLVCGEAALADHELLELLLFYAIPRQDTNPLAHRLIDTFGSLAGVLNASPADLQNIGGLSQNTACLLALMPQLMRRYAISQSQEYTAVTTSQEAVEYLLPRFFGETEERIYLLCLDISGRVLSCVPLDTGTVDSVPLRNRRVMETALALRASFLYLAHNHPSGDPTPSQEDIRATLTLAEMLRPVGITLADHIIVGRERCFSMRESGLLGVSANPAEEQSMVSLFGSRKRHPPNGG